MAFLMAKFLIGVFILITTTHFLIHLAKKVSNILKISPLIVGISAWQYYWFKYNKYFFGISFWYFDY